MKKFIVFAFLLVVSFFGVSQRVAAVQPSDFGLHEGDVISAAGDPDVYIVNAYGYKRLFVRPEIFNLYGHLGWNKIQQVTPTQRDAFITSGLFQNCETSDPKVYGLDVISEDIANLRWVNTSGAQAVADNPNFFREVFCINSSEVRLYGSGPAYTSILQIPDYSRSGTSPSPTPAVVSTGGTAPVIGGCQIFPQDNPWNQDISSAPVHTKSSAFISAIGLTTKMHPDFGGKGEYGIPYEVVDGSQAKVPITFTAYGDESDAGPYPIPSNARIEGNGTGDAHVIVLQKGTCKLYELYVAQKTTNGWSGDSGAVFNLNSNALRPLGWTSADAAGLPIMPGLVKYDEAHSGIINHAIRFTASRTQAGAILPATHFAGSNNASLPPMGLRVRLKKDFDTSTFTGEALAIVMAMKKYGLILADNGSSWFISGAMDTRWDDDNLNTLKSIPGSAFEAVYTGEIHSSW